MKKICIVSTVSYTPKNFILPHLALLSKEFDVILVSNFAEGDMEIFMSKEIGVKECFHIPFERKISVLSDIKTEIELLKYFRKSSFDYILSMTPKAGLLTAFAGVASGAKEVIHLFTGQVWANKKGLFREVLILMDRVVGWLNSRILVDGLAQRNYLVSKGVIPKSSRVLGAKNSMACVNTDRFKPNEIVRNELRISYGVQDAKVLFFLGRLNRDKGIYELVDSFISLINDYPSLKLVIAGFDEECVVEKIRERYGNLVDERIIYLGVVKEPYRYLQMADIFVLPSHREGFGCSVAEASACGIPVVCSDIWGLTDAYINNETGINFKVGETDSLSEALRRLINDPELCSRLGKRGREYVIENFDMMVMSKLWLKYFKEL
ncbi:MAG: glycosyltransferase [Bacteroidales bacterium]